MRRILEMRSFFKGKKASGNRPLIEFFGVVLIFAFVFADNIYGQSSRRTSMTRNISAARYAEEESEKEIEPQNSYMEIGKVVEVRDGCAIVLANSGMLPKIPEGWTLTIFCSDLMRNPKAILTNEVVSKHKMCNLYEIAQGQAAVGDLVIARLSPPEQKDKK